MAPITYQLFDADRSRSAPWIWCLVAVLAASLLGCAEPASEPVQEPAPGPQVSFEETPIGEWRRWRGPNGQGVSLEPDLPTVWSEGSANIRWKAFVPGAGNSSPVVSGGRIFLTAVYGEEGQTWEEAREADGSPAGGRRHRPRHRRAALGDDTFHRG